MLAARCGYLRRMKDVAAIVLAAGRSQRMGAFKPLLPFGNSTAIEACIENLRRGGVETVVVIVGVDSNAGELRRHLEPTEVTFAINPDPASEMSDSIACGVRQLPAESRAVVIIPADHPAVPPEVVVTLIVEWQKGAGLVVPTYGGRGGHPVLVDLQFRSELTNLDTQRGLKGLFQAHPDAVSRPAVNTNLIARDMDTWDDYRALHQEVFGVPPLNRPIRTKS